MQTTTCSKCANSAVPLNSSLQIDGLIYCEDCIKTDFNTDESLEDKQVVKVHDPTVCSNCGKDNGLVELPKISIYPICDDCNVAIRNKTFPTWVKAFLAFLAALILFSFCWNARFFQSKANFDASVNAFHNKDFKKASELMKLASEQVPEVWDLHLMANFYSGVALLEEDKSVEALAALETCEGKLPANFPVDMLILQAKLGAYFDQKD
jgi:DNA-directed RNA polymerase subunit RPC12/RpoP